MCSKKFTFHLTKKCFFFLELRGAGRSSTRDPYSSKGPSLERSYNKQQTHDNRRNSSRSGSQHRSADNSQRGTPVSNVTKQQIMSTSVTQPPPPPSDLTPEKLELKWKTILEEFVNECSTIKEFSEELKYFPDLDQVVINGYVSFLFGLVVHSHSQQVLLSV